jgi:hypothetical protein
MKTCARCGKDWPDSTVQCPEDGGPLGALPEVREGVGGRAEEGEVPRPPRVRSEVPLESDNDDGEPELVVRARRAVPIPPPNFTGARVLPAEPVWNEQRPSRGPVHTRRGARAGDERSLWPAVAVIALLVAVAVVGVGYYIVSEQTAAARETTTYIVNARLAVADARARVESLPVDNPLRRRILTLDKWDRELQNFELSSDRTPQIASRAREITEQAEKLSDEARAAGAPALTAPVVVTPATPQPAPIEPLGNANANAQQPPATNAQGTQPKNEAVKPPITAAPPTVPPVDGSAKPPTEQGTPGAPKPPAAPPAAPLPAAPPPAAPKPGTTVPPPPPPPVEQAKKPVP